MTADLFSDYQEQDMAEEKGTPAAAPQPETKDESPRQADAPRFEVAFERLEAVVEEMERGELPLEDLLARFEEGVGLVRQCQTFLKQAQLRVEQYVEHRDGQWVLRDLESEG